MADTKSGSVSELLLRSCGYNGFVLREVEAGRNRPRHDCFDNASGGGLVNIAYYIEPVPWIKPEIVNEKRDIDLKCC